MQTIEAVVSAPDVSGVVVGGPAGAGKSRVLREALSALSARGCVTRWAVGTSAARLVPLGALAAWTQPGVVDTVQLLHGVLESLTAGAPGSGSTVVLGLDDVHLFDELSLFIVHQIVQRNAAKVVLTIRDGEPVAQGVEEIWRIGEFDRLDLRPLTLDQTTTLLTAALAGSVDSETAGRLWRLTGGNALYLRNIVENEIAEQRIVQHHGWWRWIGEPVLPPGLVELIESRIGVLAEPVSDVVDALAVGEPIPLETLRRITDPAAVEEADTRGLIMLEQTADEVQVRLAHPIYGEVRRRRAAPTRLRRLRGRVANELVAPEGRDDNLQLAVRRAALSLESDLPPDGDLLMRGANGAVWLADLPLADRLAEAAARAGAGPKAIFVRAHALSWMGRGEQADTVLSDLETRDLTDLELAKLAFLRASNALWTLGDPPRAKAIIDDALRTSTLQGAGYIDAFLSVYWFATDHPDMAKEAAKHLASEELPPAAGAEIAWALATIAADEGRTTAAVTIAESGYGAVKRSFDVPHLRLNIADAHVSGLLLAGRIEDAVEVAERFRREAEQLPGAAEAIGAAIAGRAALGAGRLEPACTLLEQAVEKLSATHALGWGYRYDVSRATALAMQGSTCQADAALATLDTRQRAFRELDYELSLARAWNAAGHGAVSEAIAITTAAAERASLQERFAGEVICLQTATQFGDCTSITRLRELGGIVEGPRVGLAERFAAALHDGDARELSAVSEAFEQIGDIVAALDAAAHAALVYRSQGRRGSAFGCATRAETLAERCGACTPALRRVSEPLPLTDREAEVVMLLAEGLTNRAVAERLTLSVRTVESHIYRAMMKTGTNSRDELAALHPRRRARAQ